MSDERRKYPRFESRVDAEYEILGTSTRGEVETKNISAIGVCFSSKEKLPSGAKIKLSIKLDDEQPPVVVKGEVRWIDELIDSNDNVTGYLNGVKVLDIPKSDESRFLQFYCDRLVKELAPYIRK